MKNYTREEVIQVIEALLQMPDALIDAVQNENTEFDAESLLEAADEYCFE